MAVASTRRVRLGGRRIATMTGAVVVAGAAIAGCSPQEAGSAAIIGGHRVLESTVQTDVRATSAELTKSGISASSISPVDLTRDVLQLDIDKAIYTKTGDLVGVRVTPGQLSTERASVIKQVGGIDKINADLAQTQDKYVSLPPSALDDYLYVNLLVQKLAAAEQADPTRVDSALSTALKTVKVNVNPRYGTFDTTSDKVTAQTPSWLRDQDDKLPATSS